MGVCKYPFTLMTERRNPHYLILAEVVRPHGIRGEVRVRLLTDYPERITEHPQLYLGKSADELTAVTYTPERIRLQQGFGIFKFVGFDKRDDVEAWRGLFLMVPLEDAIPLEDDEFYTYQLIGVTLFTEDGREIGAIAEIMETGANDVYIVRGSEYGEVLVPDIPDMWIELDLEQGVGTVRLPDGLLPSA